MRKIYKNMRVIIEHLFKRIIILEFILKNLMISSIKKTPWSKVRMLCTISIRTWFLRKKHPSGGRSRSSQVWNFSLNKNKIKNRYNPSIKAWIIAQIFKRLITSAFINTHHINWEKPCQRQWLTRITPLKTIHQSSANT